MKLHKECLICAVMVVYTFPVKFINAVEFLNVPVPPVFIIL
jgi:hypothetical protein